MSRQNYYAERRRREEEAVDGDLIVCLVLAQRRVHPRIGVRKLLHLLQSELRHAQVKIGRDRLFSVLRARNLLVEPRRCKARTTNSRHCLPVFVNLVAGMDVTLPNQVWVADLTYIRTAAGFLYAALIMDMHSRKIVGWHIGDSLEAEGCLMALEKALADLPAGCRPVHHSDRGCQYCCHLYVDRLRGKGFAVSMTEQLHCYENAMAERLNGILKHEYGLYSTFNTKRQAIRAFEEAVHLYNGFRPHLALNYRTPAEVHAQVA